MKKIIFFLLFSLSLALAGCSPTAANKSGETKNESSGLSQNTLDEYNVMLFNAIDTSNKMLRTFNTSLDAQYTSKESNEDFSLKMRDNIEKSTELINSLEIYEVHADLFEYHQSIISHLNNQHQMFLDGIEMANDDNMDKDWLRTYYLEVKSEQAVLVNQWKNG